MTTIVFVLWCLGLEAAPIRVVAYPTEAACVAKQREASGLILEMSKVAPDAKLTPVAYSCMAEVKR